MGDEQLDLFDAGGILPERRSRPEPCRPAPVPAELDDATLVALIPEAGIADAPALAGEAARRRLAGAIPALEQLCRRLTGFGRERPVPEQIAALEALARIGGAEAGRAVARLIAGGVLQGPTRKAGLEVALQLGATLPRTTVEALLDDPDPAARAAACRLSGPWSRLVPRLLELCRDPEREVGIAAVCALGRLGRAEVKATLARLLRDAPSREVIDAIVPGVDEDEIILLGRIARTRPELSAAARDALETIDHPRARQILTGLAAAKDG